MSIIFTNGHFWKQLDPGLRRIMVEERYYFVDEASQYVGPYMTKQNAERAQEQYFKQLSTGCASGVCE